jgi:hypothetical protein
MLRNLLVFFVLLLFFFSCKEEKKLDTQAIHKERKLEIQTPKKAPTTTHFEPKAKLKPEFIPQVVPGPGYLPDPYPGPYPIDPPGYIPGPVITCVGPPDPLPKTIRDSIVNFPTVRASFGSHPDELIKYIDAKIANQMEFNYLKELGLEGKIYIRLLIDVKGKVREVNFLKFSEKELEILKPRLNTALLTMPNWTAAKDENAAAVVSEYTFPFRIQLD